MSKQRHRAQLVWLAATDNTFSLVDHRGTPALAGRCVHCNAMVIVGIDGERILRATIEHIVPRTHGGADKLENLAIACGGCNSAKGIRLDPLVWGDPKLMEVIERLQLRKAKRLRAPLTSVILPPDPDLPDPADAPAEPDGEGDTVTPPRRARGRGR